MRLIDADALIDEIKYITGQDTIMWFDDKRIKRKQAVNMADFVELMPTIDPVKHGKWKNKQMLDEELNPTIAFRHRCSECRFEICTTDETLWWQYCPNCGAKNGGEDDGPV